MDMQLRGKRAFVSGASSGLGEAIALELAAEGVSVAVHGRDRARTEATARQVEALGVEALVTTGDLSTDEEAWRCADETIARFGGVDILVNNAGNLMRKDNPDWMDVTPSEWMHSFSLNVGAAVRLSQKFAPGMAERGWGRIVNISSTAGTQHRGRNLDYGCPKAGLENFSWNLSKILGPKGVTVNVVAPGAILTPAVVTWLKTIRAQQGWPDDEEHNERVYSQSLNQSIHRLGRPREIATAVVMLASPLSGYTNGGYIRIDGGNSI